MLIDMSLCELAMSLISESEPHLYCKVTIKRCGDNIKIIYAEDNDVKDAPICLLLDTLM